MTTQPQTARSDREHAREALERVCARGDFDAARDYYSPDFIDHVMAGPVCRARATRSLTLSYACEVTHRSRDQR
jgi:hypothetical protein